MNALQKPTAILYVRVSTNRQATGGHSLDSQPAILTKKAEAEGYEVELVTETGSGRNTARPELNRALEKLAKGEAQALYAVDTDRLARSTMHLLEIAQRANKEGWRLVITSADVDTATPAGEMFLTMVAGFAQFESRMISERVKRQHQARRDRGEVWGVTAGCISTLPTETVERVLELRSQGLSMDKTAKQLNAEGVPTATGKKWFATTVSRVLNSPQRRSEALSEVGDNSRQETTK